MYVIKYDKVSMIKLVQCIEKHPEVYNTKVIYSKEEQDAAWDKIAMEVGEKESLCRERWHSIKSCYIRHLKFCALNSKRRAYYLADYLEFFKPHLSDKVRSYMEKQICELKNLPTYLKEALPSSGSKNLITIQQTDNIQLQPYEIKTEIVDVEIDEQAEWLNVDHDYQQPSSSKSKAKKSKPSSFHKEHIRQSATSPSLPNVDEDIRFFKSLLPDVARMSSHQKLKFKQEALSIIEDILYASEDVNVVS